MQHKTLKLFGTIVLRSNMTYYYVVFSMFHNGNEYMEGKILNKHPLVFKDPNPVVFWQEIPKDVAEQRKDLWLVENN